MDQIRYAKKDIYAEVAEEGGAINRLIALQGQPVPVAYAELVDDKDTTTDVNVAHELTRTTAARRARAGQVVERSHEEFREIAAGEVGPRSEAHAPPKASRAKSAAKDKS